MKRAKEILKALHDLEKSRGLAATRPWVKPQQPHLVNAIEELTLASFACASGHILYIAKEAFWHVQPDPVVHAARRAVADRSSTNHREVGCFHGNHCTSRNWPFSFNQEADFAPIYRTGFDAALARLPFFPTKMKQAVERKAFMQSPRGRIIGIA